MDVVILPLHLLILGFVGWNIFQADHLGFKWMRGTRAMLDKAVLEKYHLRVWIGLLGMIATGLLLFWPMREYLLARPQFYLKMAFVATLIINAFVIGHLQTKATRSTYASLSFKEKLPLFISGAVSTCCWLGAATTALFLVQD